MYTRRLFSNCKNSKTIPPKFDCFLDDVTVLKRFKIVTVAWFTFSRFYPIGMKQCMFRADVNT